MSDLEDAQEKEVVVYEECKYYRDAFTGCLRR